MRLLAYFRSLAAKFFHRSQTGDEMEEEVRSHIRHRVADLERCGMNRDEAERRARIEFGGQERFKEECYDELGGNFFDTLMQDLRFSMRVLRKSPGFTAVAVLTLALGIGANAVVFSVLNAVILRPLNVPQAESLYMIERGNDHTAVQSYPDYLDFRDRNRTFAGLAAYSITAVGLDTGNNPTRTWVEEVSGNYFDALFLEPHLGRFFHGSDEHGPNSAPYIVLTYDFWHSRFQDDGGVVGRVVRLNQHPFTVVGVTPPEFHGTLMFFHPDFFVPMVNQEQIEGRNDLNARGSHEIFSVLGHLKSGVTPAQAVADMNSIGAYLEKTYPKDDGRMTFSLARPSLYGNFLGPPVKAFLLGLTLLAGLILLAACVNLGNLFAARSADRSRDVALRLALGAGRVRILRQLFTEALLLSVAGGAAGLLGSIVLLRSISAWQPIPRFPIHVPVNPDARVYGLALILAIVSGILFGLAPVRQVLMADPYRIIKSGSMCAVGRRITIRDLMLAAQIAICAVLVTSSMVAVRGLSRSLHSDFGFAPQHVLMADTDVIMVGYHGEEARTMQRRMIDTVETIAGVKSVGLIDHPPLSDEGSTSTFIFTDKTTDLRPANAAAEAMTYAISPGYFQAAGTALLSGRAVTWHDDKSTPPVAVVNREFARKLFGSVENAIGGYYKRRDGTRIQVVGIVEDGKYESLTEDPQAAMFFPTLQSPSSQTFLLVHTDRDPEQLAPLVRAKLRDLNASLPVTVRPWEREMDNVLFAPRMATMSLGVLGAMGAMLTVTGIFGMAAYSVSRRLKELGIRLALGGQRKEVLRAALGRAFQLLAFGSTVGLAFGILASRLLASIVYQATPRDPLVLAGVVLSMLVLGLLATWIPARRALSVDPLTLLREE